MLLPKKSKFRKQFRRSAKGKETRGFRMAFGLYGLKTLDKGWITARQIESARRAVTRYIKREGQLWIRIFPDKPVTAQPAETGMGGGKGAVSHYVAPVLPGRILFEMAGIDRLTAKEALRLASHKLPVETKFIEKKVVGI